MKTIFTILMICTGFVSLQASYNDSKLKSYDLESLSIAADAYSDDFKKSKKAQMVFFAIQQGFDYNLVEKLVNNALKSSPSTVDSELFKSDVTKLFKLESPLVKKLIQEENCGSRKASDRKEFREMLSVINELPSVYNNSLKTYVIISAIERNRLLYQKPNNSSEKLLVIEKNRSLYALENNPQ